MRRSDFEESDTVLAVVCGLVASAQHKTRHNRVSVVTTLVSRRAGFARGMSRISLGIPSGNGWSGINFSRMFCRGCRILVLRPELAAQCEQAGLPDSSGHLQSVAWTASSTVPRHIGRFGVYGICGFWLDDRVFSAHSELLTNGSVCQQAYYRLVGH